MSSCSNSECTRAEVIDSAERRQSLPGGLNLIEDTEDLLWARPHRDVVGEINPANRSAGTNQKLGGPRNVRAFRSRRGMQHIVTPNDFRFGIRKQRKCIAEFLRLPAVHLGWIDADTDDADAACIELGKLLLETPQLGVAKRSPKTAIENQHGSR
jgi:hypothetical protein